MRAFFPHVRKPWGKIPHKGGLAVLHLLSQNFFTLGEGRKDPRGCLRAGGNHAGTPKHSAVFAAPFVNFRRSFSAVAAIAQALEIHAINEQPPISTVIHDMIHICCPSPDPTLRTRTTPWLMQKLRWSQILSQISVPYIQRHDLDVSLRRSPQGLCLSQYPAAVSVWHPGWRHSRIGLFDRAITSSRNKKRRCPMTVSPLGRSWAPAFYALASCNIQDDFRLAVPAPYRQAVGLRFRIDAEQFAIASAVRTDNPSVHYR